MALPGNVGTGTVTGNLMDSLGNPTEGTVTFIPSFTRLVNVTAVPALVILPKPVTVTLSAGGFTTSLVATDDADNNPTGWTYKVSFKLTGSTVADFHIAVPENSLQDLATLAPVGSANGVLITRGPGVPDGGTTGQVLAKVSADDLDTAWVDQTGGGGGEALTSYVTQVESLADYPSTFPPAAHDHAIGDVTGLQTALDGKQAAGSYATDTELTDGLAGKQAVGDYATNTTVTTGLAGKVDDASGQTTRWRGLYADEGSLPTGQAGDWAIITTAPA